MAVGSESDFDVGGLPEGGYDAVIFDCDGTLADSMPLHYESWRVAVEARGAEFPEALFYAWGGKTGHDIIADLNAHAGLQLDIADTVAAKQAYYLEHADRVPKIEAVCEIAEHLRGRIKIAVASGGRRKLVRRTLTAIGAIDWFDTIVCAGDYERSKPAPDAYLEAARRLGVAPERCVVFEDSETGFTAVEAAGMHLVRVIDRRMPG